jgi:hypothetical protein
MQRSRHDLEVLVAAPESHWIDGSWVLVQHWSAAVGVIDLLEHSQITACFREGGLHRMRTLIEKRSLWRRLSRIPLQSRRHEQQLAAGLAFGRLRGRDLR